MQIKMILVQDLIKVDFGSYKFWLAHYTKNTNYTGSYQMWQYTSNGSVNGISGRVDMNIAYFRFSAVAEPKHTHDFEHGSVINTPDSKAATCTQNGIKYIRCASCSESQKVDIPATGHSFGEWTVREKATVEKAGVEVRKCKNCDAEETRPIEKLKTNNNNTNTNTNTNSNTNNTNNNTQNNNTSNTNTETNTNINNNSETNTNINTNSDTNTNIADENNTAVEPTQEQPAENTTPTEETSSGDTNSVE